jgi:hypothetical protein
MGQVRNERDQAVDMVQVQAVLYNTDGELIDRAAAFTLADIVPGGGTAPFAILFPDASAAGYATYEIELLSAQPIENWGGRHGALSIEDMSWSVEGERIVVTGTVTNQGQADARDIRVTLTAYGTGGTVIAVRQLQVDAIPSKENQAFIVSLVPAAQVVQIDAVAWGMRSGP